MMQRKLMTTTMITMLRNTSTSNIKSDFDRPVRVRDADWRVYEIVSAAADEFNEKF